MSLACANMSVGVDARQVRAAGVGSRVRVSGRAMNAMAPRAAAQRAVQRLARGAGDGIAWKARLGGDSKTGLIHEIGSRVGKSVASRTRMSVMVRFASKYVDHECTLFVYLVTEMHFGI
eukprot:6224733-Pyramimonas_sp.AAC.1